MNTKQCPKCNKIIKLHDFNKNKNGKDGLQYQCKLCDIAYRVQNSQKIAATKAEYRLKNKEKITLYNKNYDTNNRNSRSEYNLSWRLAHSKEKAEYDSNYRKTHKEKIIKYRVQYAKNNPGMVNARHARRYAAKLKATPKWITEEHWKQIENFYIKASELTKQTGVVHHVDHIIPLQGKNVKGLHVPWNLQILTANENLKKGNKY